MVLLVKKMFIGYQWLFNEVADPRAKDLFLMNSMFQPFMVMGFYLYFVFKLGPALMKDRPPFNIDKIVIVFNFIQVVINAYIVYVGSCELLHLSWTCAEVDYESTPHNLFLLRVVHLYFLMKLSDLLDTVFFILRKKSNQVSFLHVYHHFGMIAIGWIGVKFVGGGHSIFLGVANSFVHVVMYFYYLLTIWKPEYKKNIWWKKYITQLQIVQFIFFVITYGQILFQSCNYPKITGYFIVPQSIFMICLFGDFYYKAYIKPYKSKEGAKAA